MRHKRLKLSILFLIGLGLTGLQAQTMYLKEISGTQTAYALSHVQKMTFSSGNVHVHKTDNTTGVYALSGLKYLSFINISTAINEKQLLAGNANLIAYPNPVTEMLNIDLSGSKNEIGTIGILSLKGKVLQIIKTSKTDILTLNLSHLPQGIYICCYSNKRETRTTKFIKQ